MANYDEIFSAEIPMPLRERKKTLVATGVVKPKRKYTRRANIAQKEVIKDIKPADSIPAEIVAPLSSLEDISFSSRGIEYMRVLIMLLKLLSEEQRDKLIDFIIEAKLI